MCCFNIVYLTNDLIRACLLRLSFLFVFRKMLMEPNVNGIVSLFHFTTAINCYNSRKKKIINRIFVIFKYLMKFIYAFQCDCCNWGKCDVVLDTNQHNKESNNNQTNSRSNNIQLLPNGF